jgi:hypothetical protein
MDESGQGPGNRFAVTLTHRLSVLGSILLASVACTAERAYTTAQAWQRNQCAQMPDKADYDRCVRNAYATYDSYKRETGSGQSGAR